MSNKFYYKVTCHSKYPNWPWGGSMYFETIEDATIYYDKMVASKNYSYVAEPVLSEFPQSSIKEHDFSKPISPYPQYVTRK